MAGHAHWRAVVDVSGYVVVASASASAALGVRLGTGGFWLGKGWRMASLDPGADLPFVWLVQRPRLKTGADLPFVWLVQRPRLKTGADLPSVWLVQRPGLPAGADLPSSEPAQRPMFKARADLTLTSRDHGPRLARSQPLPTLPQPKTPVAQILRGLPLVRWRRGAAWRSAARSGRQGYALASAVGDAGFGARTKASRR
jgi:hypothetical protein